MTNKKRLEMKRLLIIGVVGGWVIAIAATFFIWTQHQPAPIESPYVAQLASEVRGLSPQEIDDLLNGRGAGFARTAELNSYPGPRHVLDAQAEMELSPETLARIEIIFEEMEAEAQQLGQAIVEQEAQLSRGFADETLSPSEMQEQVKNLGLLYGQLRGTHLRAHFTTKALLTPEQIALYDQLRGYTNGGGFDPSQHQGH